jgi:purine nucleoside phosphorylase
VRRPIVPEVAIIPGTGLSGLAGQVRDSVVLGYEDIPGFQRVAARTEPRLTSLVQAVLACA